jgi:hypothetical protein
MIHKREKDSTLIKALTVKCRDLKLVHIATNEESQGIMTYLQLPKNPTTYESLSRLQLLG